MKWIFFFLLSFITFESLAQGDDSTKYVWYKYQYGLRMDRTWADSAHHIPFLDTTDVKGAKIGAIMICDCDTLLYKWNGTGWEEVGGGTDKLDSLHIYTAADPSPDTLYSYKNGDSTLVGLLQKGGTDNANIGVGFRVLVPSTQEVKTLFSDITGTWDSTSNADGLTYKVDTLTMSTRAWRQKGDDSVAAVLRQVVIDTANSLLASMSDSVVFAVSNMLIPARIEFVHAGSDTTMYQNDTLIGKQLVDVSIEGYKLGFTARASSVYMEFDSVTGTITLTNGAFVADDLILIIYRTPPIFLLDGSGNPVRDGSGNFIILN